MPDNTSEQSVDKLFEISTRIDERVKAIQEKQRDLEGELEDMLKGHYDNLQKIAVLESKGDCSDICGINQVVGHIDDISKSVNNLDKRLAEVESATSRTQDRWKQVATFIIQLIWVLLASWLLVKLNLQSPAVP